ncbi:MAG: Ig-like domain-containing protein, partial [Planctomycetota bacterium]
MGSIVSEWTPLAGQDITLQLTDHVLAAIAAGDTVISFVLTSWNWQAVSYASQESPQWQHRPTMTVQMLGENRTPETNPDAYQTINGGATLQIPASDGVLANDSDPDGAQPLEARVDQSPASGTLILNANGSFQYTPQENFVGTDSFTYIANDGNVDSAPQTVSIDVQQATEMPFLPVADAFTFGYFTGATTNYGRESTLDVNNGYARYGYLRFDLSQLEGDIHDATLKLHALQANGTGIIHSLYQVDDGTWMEDDITWNNQPAAGSLITNWTPLANSTSEIDLTEYLTAALQQGQDVLNFVIKSNSSLQVQYASREHEQPELRPQLLLNVAGDNRPPIGANDSYLALNGGYELSVDASEGVLANDHDPDGAQPLSVALESDVSNGDLTLNPDGSFLYIADADFVGLDTFVYSVFDENGYSDSITATIDVRRQLNMQFQPVADS